VKRGNLLLASWKGAEQRDLLGRANLRKKWRGRAAQTELIRAEKIEQLAQPSQACSLSEEKTWNRASAPQGWEGGEQQKSTFSFEWKSAMASPEKRPSMLTRTQKGDPT